MKSGRGGGTAPWQQGCGVRGLVDGSLAVGSRGFVPVKGLGTKSYKS